MIIRIVTSPIAQSRILNNFLVPCWLQQSPSSPMRPVRAGLPVATQAVPSLHYRKFSGSRPLLASGSLLGRMKQMIKDYWYIIIPMEVVTSVFWYGSIFLTLKSGVDIVQLLASLGVSTETLAKLPAAGGDTGYHALTFVCYKVISPVRHTLVLALSTGLVARLEKTKPGYLKTSSDIVAEAKEVTKEDIREKYQEGKEKYHERVAEGRERLDELKVKAGERKQDIKNMYAEYSKKK